MRQVFNLDGILDMDDGLSVVLSDISLLAIWANAKGESGTRNIMIRKSSLVNGE